MTLPTFLHPFAQPRATNFLRLVGGEGSVVWDDDGRRYIDAMASLWYMNIGHGRSEMTEAIADQVGTLAAYHTFAPFSNRPSEDLADRIAGLSPFDDARVFLTNSGSEAVDSAMKLARVAHLESGHPERTFIISRGRGYHGTNFGGTSAQGIEGNRQGWGPLVGDVVQSAPDDIEGLSRMFDEHAGRVAAVLCEPLQGAGGVFPPVDGYLESLRRLCDDTGAFLIFDEVITGFGRLGHWFGAQAYGVEPDMITFAKAVTSGYQPLGGVVVGNKVRKGLEANEGFVLRHGYTYSGHPVAARAGLVAIDIQEREGLVERAHHIGARLEPGLRAMHTDGLVSAVRGQAAVWAVDVPDGLAAAEVRDRILADGVIVRPIDNSLIICPPLVIEDAQIDRVVDAVASALARSTV